MPEIQFSNLIMSIDVVEHRKIKCSSIIKA